MKKAEFIKYLESKDFAKRTLTGCLNRTKQFFNYVEKEDIQVTKPDVLKYLEHLKNKGLQNASRKHHLTAISHYFTHLYTIGTITESPCWFIKIRGANKKILYKIYTPEELEQLFDNYWHYFVRNFDNSHQRHERQKQSTALCRERNALILSILINQGIVATDIFKIEISDIDLIKATIKIRGGKRLNDRTLALKATQIGLIMNYLQNIRPQLLEYHTSDNNKLFVQLTVANKKITNKNGFAYILDRFTDQVRLIDKQLINFTQIRASVITHWLKTYGLRKTQYMAGHRNISTTEQFLPNNLEDLTSDINKLHPF